jgi:hypothetical protein
VSHEIRTYRKLGSKNFGELSEDAKRFFQVLKALPRDKVREWPDRKITKPQRISFRVIERAEK